MIEKELRNEIVKELEQMYRTLEINMENIKDYIKLLKKLEYKDASSTKNEFNSPAEAKKNITSNDSSLRDIHSQNKELLDKDYAKDEKTEGGRK